MTKGQNRLSCILTSPYKLLIIKYKLIHILQRQGHYCLITFTIQVPVKILLAIALLVYVPYLNIGPQSSIKSSSSTLQLMNSHKFKNVFIIFFHQHTTLHSYQCVKQKLKGNLLRVYVPCLKQNLCRYKATT